MSYSGVPHGTRGTHFVDSINASSQVGWDHILIGKKKFRVANIPSKITVFIGTTCTICNLKDSKCLNPSLPFFFFSTKELKNVRT